jgi:hypothetical protein
MLRGRAVRTVFRQLGDEAEHTRFFLALEGSSRE